MTNNPTCYACQQRMELVRVVPGWRLVPAVECFQCECGSVETRHANIAQMPVAGPHAQPHLTNYDASPGTGMLSDGPNMQPSS